MRNNEIFSSISKILKSEWFNPDAYNSFLTTYIYNKQCNDFSIWDLFLMWKSDLKSGLFWSDIEGLMSDSFSEKNSNDSQKSKPNFWDKRIVEINNRPRDHFKPWNVSNRNETMIAKYLLLTIEATNYNNIEPSDVYNYLEAELRKFEYNFCNYLNDLIFTHSTFRENQRKLIHKLVNEEANILSFNYTNLPTVELIQSVENVHGSLDRNNCIIGIDGSNIDFENPSYRFTKTLRKIAQYTEVVKKVNKILCKNIRSISFYGHSLNPQDYSYFQTIFDFFDIYKEDISLFFYYSVYKKEKEQEIKKTTYESVVRLINQYGTTFSTEPYHGKNLLHKLLIESRISIIEIEEL